MTTPIRPLPGTVAGPAGDPLAEAIELTKRLKLPHLRRALTGLIPTAKAQRWDPAEVVRVLLAEEAAGRDQANLRTRRKRAAFPTGKTFQAWDENASSIPGPPKTRSAPWSGSPGGRTCASAGHRAPASPTSAKHSATPRSKPA